MSNISVLIGAPGAGKGTQARLLRERLGISHISTGDMFREIQNAETPLAKEVKEILASGKLMPDEITYEMVKERTAREDCADTYILDGFPRTPRQAEMLEELAKEQGKLIDAILIEVPFEDLEKRLTGRRSCPTCGEIYNIHYKPSKVDGYCDIHPDAALVHRRDDNEEKVKVRLETYEENTKPLLDYYARSGRLKKIDGTSEPSKIYKKLEGLVAVNKVSV